MDFPVEAMSEGCSSNKGCFDLSVYAQLETDIQNSTSKQQFSLPDRGLNFHYPSHITHVCFSLESIF